MKLIKRLISLAVISLLCITVWLFYYANSPLILEQQPTKVTIEPNSSLGGIANQLVSAGVLKQRFAFKVLARIVGKESTLKAGEYHLENSITPMQLLAVLSKGGQAPQAKITFIEGKTFKNIRLQLSQHQQIKQTISQLSNKTILTTIGASQTHPEGLFFPDTYFFNPGTTDIEILKRAYQAMQKHLAASWENRAADLPYKNSYEALIMASIIEKETGKASERAEIGGVFVNRLRIDMRLQTDPTVIYGMGDRFDGNIRRKDLRKDTRYNTYTRYGLPPTPIAMPSLAAIEAALHPAETKSLYFVGKGDGSHAFSNTLAQHNRAVRRYQLKRK